MSTNRVTVATSSFGSVLTPRRSTSIRSRVISARSKLDSSSWTAARRAGVRNSRTASSSCACTITRSSKSGSPTRTSLRPVKAPRNPLIIPCLVMVTTGPIGGWLTRKRVKRLLFSPPVDNTLTWTMTSPN